MLDELVDRNGQTLFETPAVPGVRNKHRSWRVYHLTSDFRPHRMLRLVIILLFVVAGTPRAWMLPDATARPAISVVVACCSVADSLADSIADSIWGGECCGGRLCVSCVATGCSCGVRPLRNSDPAPVAPVPTVPTAPRDLVVLARIDGVVAVTSHPTPAPPRIARVCRALHAERSSHEFRAVLGIWLT